MSESTSGRSAVNGPEARMLRLMEQILVKFKHKSYLR
jgi:hypothetical protein